MAFTVHNIKWQRNVKMSEICQGKTLLIEQYNKKRRLSIIRGLLFFVLSSLAAILICIDWRGGIQWLFVVALMLTGMYGFADLVASTKMTDFDTSPMGLFLSGESKKHTLAALLIRRSDENAAGTGEKYKAEISFVEKSGARVSISVRGYESCRQIIDYLKERLTENCQILDMTFDEYKTNRREHAHTR